MQVILRDSSSSTRSRLMLFLRQILLLILCVISSAPGVIGFHHHASSSSSSKLYDGTSTSSTCRPFGIARAKRRNDQEDPKGDPKEYNDEDDLLALLPEDTSYIDNINRARYLRFAAAMRRELGLTNPKKIQAMVKRQITLIGLTESLIVPRIHFLQEQLDLTDGERTTLIFREPQILAMDSGTVLSKIESWQTYLGNRTLVKTLAMKYCSILVKSFESCFAPKMEFCLEHCFDGNDTELKKYVLKHPSYILNYSLKRIQERMEVAKSLDIDPRVMMPSMCLPPDKFEERFGVRLNEETKKLSNLNKFDRFEAFWTRELGGEVAQVKKITKNDPSLLQRSETSWSNTLHYLRELLEPSSNQEMMRILVMSPQLFVVNTKKIQKTVDFLQEEVFAGDIGAVRNLLWRYPPVMIQTSTKTKQTLDVLAKMSGDHNVAEVVLRYPAILRSPPSTLERNAAAVLEDWFLGNRAVFLKEVHWRYVGAGSVERTKSRLADVRRIGLDYTKLRNVAFLSYREKIYSQWIIRRQEEADRRAKDD